MIFFQISLNFDSVKEILQMRCQIYFLMKKVINYSEETSYVIIKSFTPPFLNHFRLSLHRKKHGNES